MAVEGRPAHTPLRQLWRRADLGAALESGGLPAFALTSVSSAHQCAQAEPAFRVTPDLPQSHRLLRRHIEKKCHWFWQF